VIKIVKKEKEFGEVVQINWKKLAPIIIGLILGVIIVSVLFKYFGF